MEKEERVKYSEGQVHEAMVRLKGEGLTPEGLQKIVDSRELAEQIVSMVEKIVEKTRVPVLMVNLKKRIQNYGCCFTDWNSSRNMA